MSTPRVAAIVLAAGASTRMRGAHKLLEPVDGAPLATWAARAALDSVADPVVVVTGHRAGEVEAVLPEGCSVVRNADYTSGLSSSLRAGLETVPAGHDAAVILLGDMPRIGAEHVDALVRAWRPGAIVVPVLGARRGHPVLWSRVHFDEMCRLDGDRGARGLLESHADAVVEVPAPDDAILLDVDTRDDLERIRRNDR